MTTLTTLTTERLTMQQLTAEDWPLFLRLYQDPLVTEFMTDKASEEEIYQLFTSRLPTWNKHASHWLCLVIREKSTGAAVGLTGLLAGWSPFQQAEVGFLLLPEFQRRGYGGESLHAVCDFALGECGFHRLNAAVTEGNVASRRTLEKCGFQLEGTLRESYQLGGIWRNDWVFGRLAGE
ncbi:GNAT family N-acetyltransferase [Edaphovirga cremea]|uniref:GNAT family N-acetyltransferase n=1 Tax=Edaphovirga cremea TaxID=2267246 RepID=UPI0039897F8D